MSPVLSKLKENSILINRIKKNIFLHFYIMSICESSTHGIRVNTDDKRKKSFPRNWVVVVEIIKSISCSKPSLKFCLVFLTQ